MISTDDGIKIMDGGSTSFKPFAAESNKKDDDNTMDIPTPAPFVQVSLQQLKEKLDATPYEVKSSLVYAKQVNADLVNDDHLLGFLYVEKFNIDLALKRLLRYWTNRHKLFGDKYTQPLTLHGAMSDRIEDIRKGYLILLPKLDEKGRAMIYLNTALMGEQQVDEECFRVWWYLIHVAMENPSCRKNGFIILGNDKDMKLRHMHPRRGLGIIKSGTKDFPIQLQTMHLCNPLVFTLLTSVVKATLPMRLRQTLTIHTGSSDDVLKSLAACSIPKSCIPTIMGGTLDTSLESSERLVTPDQGSVSNDVGTSTSSPNDTNVRTRSMAANISDSTLGSISSQNNPLPNKAAKAKAGERKIKHKKHPGRNGDIRMRKAVNARHQDSNISLLSALLAGGFVFPDMYKPGVKLSKVKDLDGVTVYQRKNQLNRRLREERNRRQTKLR